MAIIYKATNTINGKAYIGFTSHSLKKRMKEHKNRTNNSSESRYFHNAIRKWGWDAFVWNIILENATLDDEIRLISEHNTFWENEKGYNLTKGGEGRLGNRRPHSEETKAKIRAARAKQVYSDEARENMRLAQTGKKLSEEHKAKIGAKSRGRLHTQETKNKMSTAFKGRTISEEHKKKISNTLLGRSLSQETKNKMKGRKAWNKNKPHSQDHKDNLKLAWERRRNAKTN